MQIKLHITTLIGDATNEVKFELEQADEIQKMSVITGMFGVLGVDVPEMFQTYEKIGKAYRDFFNATKPVEPITIEPVQITVNQAMSLPSTHELAKKYSDKVREAKSQPIAFPNYEKKEPINTLGEKLQQAIDKQVSEQPEQYDGTRMKYGVPHYKCRLNCPKCRVRKNQYIQAHVETVRCWDCGEILKVDYAVEGQYLEKDEWNNYFKAEVVVDEEKGTESGSADSPV